MRRLLGLMTLLALLVSITGCYKGRGICDCLDYRDPCCYGCHCYGGAQGPGGIVDGQLVPTPLPPGFKGETLKAMPKELEKAPPKPKDNAPPLN